MKRHQTGILALLWALGLGAVGACGDPAGGSRDWALSQALKTSAGEARPGEMLRVHPLPLPGISAHEADMKTVYKVGAAGAERVVTIVRHVARDGDSRWRITQDRSYQAPDLPHGGDDGLSDGRQGRFSGGAFASRRASGPWISHSDPDDSERWLWQAYGDLDSAVAAFGAAVQWNVDASKDQRMMGLSVRWATASLDPKWAAPVADATSRQALAATTAGFGSWLQASHRLQSVNGQVAFALDKDGAADFGKPVAGSLSFVGDAGDSRGTRRPFEFVTTRQLRRLGGDVDFEIPEATLASKRTRPWRMIKSVLGEAMNDDFQRLP